MSEKDLDIKTVKDINLEDESDEVLDPAIFKQEDPNAIASSLEEAGYIVFYSEQGMDWLRKNDEIARPVMLQSFQEKIERILQGEGGDVEFEILLPLFYLIEMHETEIFKPLLKQIQKPDDQADLLWMVMQGVLDRIFYAAYDGDLEAVMKFMDNPSVDDLDKSAMIDAMAQKYSDGDLTADQFSVFLDPLLQEETAVENPVLYSSALHYVDMLSFQPAIERAKCLLEEYPDPRGITDAVDLDIAVRYSWGASEQCFLYDEDDQEQKNLYMEEAGLHLLKRVLQSVDYYADLYGMRDSDDDSYNYEPLQSEPDQENEKQRARNKKAKTKKSKKNAKKARKANRKK